MPKLSEAKESILMLDVDCQLQALLACDEIDIDPAFILGRLISESAGYRGGGRGFSRKALGLPDDTPESHANDAFRLRVVELYRRFLDSPTLHSRLASEQDEEVIRALAEFESVGSTILYMVDKPRYQWQTDALAEEAAELKSAAQRTMAATLPVARQLEEKLKPAAGEAMAQLFPDPNLGHVKMLTQSLQRLANPR